MDEILLKHLNVFKKLRIDRSRGPAPHKPILLISILQAFKNGIISNNQIYISPELVALFQTNWNLLVKSNHDCRFALPFYHLTGDKFWKLIPKPGFELIIKFSSSMRSFTNLNAAVEFAIIDDDLTDLMKDKNNNTLLVEFLLQEYFSDTKDYYRFSLDNQQTLLDDIENKIFYEPSEQYKTEIENLIKNNNEEEIFLRGSIFKREIPKIYNNTCSISGMRIDAMISVSMIDACHIIPFSVSFDDTIKNGVALCPNLHRAFDRGLISIDDDYRVIVSNLFKEEDSNYGIKTFENNRIIHPTNKAFLPDRENLRWHRKYIFKN